MATFLRRLAGEFSNKPPIVLFSIFLFTLAFSLLLLGCVIDHSEFANPDFKNGKPRYFFVEHENCFKMIGSTNVSTLEIFVKAIVQAQFTIIKVCLYRLQNWNEIIHKLSHQKLDLTTDRVDGLIVPNNVVINKTNVPAVNVSLPLTFTVRNCCRSFGLRHFQHKAVKTILPMSILDNRLFSEFPSLNFTVTLFLGDINKNLSGFTFFLSNRSYYDSTFCRVFPTNYSIFAIPDSSLDCKHNCTEYYTFIGNINHHYDEHLTVWISKEARNVIFIRLQYCSYVALVVVLGFIILAGSFGRPKAKVLLSSSFTEAIDSDEDGIQSY
ncbi:uncharacterized protein TRIADDRAFT_57258 [Trichoplax adhaerens]|uniref:TMEM248/TMEM219 domain-containing protein n=1 Tax=Trichoplax adhaerens TaxID=10228 RepID=B3RYY3_TRIAD|nr:predicted protein [Trichoplax adhaerens]EDV23751.1 predicted protein [Trichoplax adhaerens]|eukprot:XP_002113277.1 predicted protein [Trichoplax adhaerens]